MRRPCDASGVGYGSRLNLAVLLKHPDGVGWFYQRYMVHHLTHTALPLTAARRSRLGGSAADAFG